MWPEGEIAAQAQGQDCPIRDIAGEGDWAAGIMADTPIATPTGWRRAGDLELGAEVLTFDHGPRPITWLQRDFIGETAFEHWPLLIPAWVLDNREALLLLPQQQILLEADLAEALYGDPFALIPSLALDGWQGITRLAPPAGAEAVILGFDLPQVLYASRGVLLACPGLILPEGRASSPLEPEPVRYSHYSLSQARALMAGIMAEEAGAALRLAAPPEGFASL